LRGDKIEAWKKNKKWFCGVMFFFIAF
jgi:hypothetical protein